MFSFSIFILFVFYIHLVLFILLLSIYLYYCSLCAAVTRIYKRFILSYLNIIQYKSTLSRTCAQRLEILLITQSLADKHIQE